MLQVSFPAPQFKTRTTSGQQYILDNLRKKWVLLTPEEWVRQNFVNYLVQTIGVPQGFIAIEKEIQLAVRKKRFDMLVYNNQHVPALLVECKAADVALTEEVIMQALSYHSGVQVSYLVITNGNQSWGWQNNNAQLILLNNLPPWHTW